MRLLYGNGDAYLESDVEITVFKIRYKGKINIESELSQIWVIMGNKGVIIGVALRPEKLDLLFKYTGKINVIGCEISDINLNTSSIIYKRTGVDYWDKQLTNWDSFNSYPEDYNRKDVVGSIPIDFSIKQINLLTNRDEFYFKDGTNYHGEYHRNNGEAISGSNYSKDSKPIFRRVEKKELQVVKESYKKPKVLPKDKSNTIKGGFTEFHGGYSSGYEGGGSE